ncbi:MAG: hypothetical protein ACE5OW_08240, partial [Candidatus Bathyarchaeia archaeon]
KLVLAAACVLGVGYITSNMATLILLHYLLSQFTMSSVPIIIQMCGIILFMVASILLMVLGAFLILGGLQFYRRITPSGVMFLGVLLASFYLLCLGIGSAMILGLQSISVLLLIIGSVLVMAGAATYMAPSFSLKFVGSVLGIAGGILLAIVTFNLQVLRFVFVEWYVPFLGPFMSMTMLEAVAVVLGSVSALVHLILKRTKEEPVSHVLLSIVALIYGIGVFIGPLTLSFSLWDLIWKAPWLPPLHGVPGWVLKATILWSGSLIIPTIAGIILIVCSFSGFAFAAQEFFSAPPSFEVRRF